MVLFYLNLLFLKKYLLIKIYLFLQQIKKKIVKL